MFDAHIPDKYRDRAPRVVDRRRRRRVWVFEGRASPNIGLNAVAGCPPEEYGLDPTEYDQMRPGCYDIHERVRDMNATGVLGSLNFPTFPHFCGQLFAAAPDKDLALAVVRAYNDWHIDEWAGAYPDRFIPLVDPAALGPAGDGRRDPPRRGQGLPRGDVLREPREARPARATTPTTGTRSWRRARTTGMVVCLHIGSSSSMLDHRRPDAPLDVMISLTPMNIVPGRHRPPVVAGSSSKFPTLRIAMSEGGIGWIPYALERIDYVYEHHQAWTGADFGGRRPSEVFREHFVTCFIDDAAGSSCATGSGVDAIDVGDATTRTPTRTWPHSAELLCADARRAPRRRHRQDHAPQRDARLPVRPVRAPAEGAVHGAARCAPRRPTSTCRSGASGARTRAASWPRSSPRSRALPRSTRRARTCSSRLQHRAGGRRGRFGERRAGRRPPRRGIGGHADFCAAASRSKGEARLPFGHRSREARGRVIA